MRVVLGALALAIATPAAAQSAPPADAHAGHAQHAEEQQGQPQPSHPSEHAEHMKDCCEKMRQQGQAMECCDKQRNGAGEAPADHSQHRN